MKVKYGLVAAAFLSLVACRTHLNITKIQPEKNIRVMPSIAENERVKSLIAPYKKTMEEQMNSKISHTDVELTKVGDNSNLGNLLADYTYEGASEWAAKNGVPQVDAAVINIGGIRSTIGKGDILLKHIFEVMPFENEVVIVKMKGTEVAGLFNYYKEKKNNPVSRLVIETDGNTLQQSLIGGQPLDLEKTYYIATSDYLAFGGDKMWFFSKSEMISTGVKLRDLFIEKFKQNPRVKIPTDTRLIFK